MDADGGVGGAGAGLLCTTEDGVKIWRLRDLAIQQMFSLAIQ
jgi:hypothetical protein